MTRRRITDNLCSLLALLAVVAACVDGAQAQAIFTTIPSALSHIAPRLAPELKPAESPAPRVDAAAPPPVAASPAQGLPSEATATVNNEAAPIAAASKDDEPTTVLRHLTNNIQGFRLAGEIGSSEWPIYLTNAQTRQRLRFQVGYLTAVSVMPEASYLTLTINDTIVGRVNIRATHAVRTMTFDIPQGLMQPGFNSVRLTAEQRHRVDCSIQATYELWTQIDPSQTGLVLQRNLAGVTSLSELAALSPDSQGALPIRAVVPGRTSLANVERIIRVSQLISLAGRFEQPVVDIGGLADGEYGLNLVIGTTRDISSSVELPGIGEVSGARIAVLPAVPGRRTTVIVTGVTDEEVSQALAQFDMGSALAGTGPGLRAASAFPGYRVQGGQRVSLRELGVVSEEFGGRLFRAAFNVIMPPDFYPADYAKAVLDLAGGYAPGLTTEAQMVVSVNGRNAVSRKLSKSGGDVFTQAPVPLPLSALRPGLNRIEIEAQVPTASDTGCDPLTSIGGPNRFLFLDSTELEIPRIARIARMPDLAVTSTGGFPYAGTRTRARLVVPNPDRDAIGATATIAAQMAIASGSPIDFELTSSLPEEGTGASLIVASSHSLDAALLKRAGVDPVDLKSAWGDQFDARPMPAKDETLSRFEQAARDRLVLQRNFPASCNLPKPLGGFEHADQTAWRNVDRMPVASIPAGTQSGKLYEEWNSKLNAKSGFAQSLSKYSDNARFWFGSKWNRASAAVMAPFDTRVHSARIPARTSLIVAQNMLGDSRDDVVTLIAAPNSPALAASVACLVDPRVWRQISGRMSFLDASEGAVTAVPADDPRLIVTEPLTIENTRLIAAGWLSLNSPVFVGLALAVAMLLAVSTTLFVQGVGRRNE